jgi:prepilin-type N-terminal cleavage/methylation domain-containing protein
MLNSVKKNLKCPDEKGFSLVEVMIAVSLLTLISYGLMSIMTNATKQQNSIFAKDSMRELAGEIRNLLSNPIACTKTFGANLLTIDTGANPDLFVNRIKDAMNNDKYLVGSRYNNNLLKLTTIKLNSLSIDAGSVPVTGVAKLDLVAEKMAEIQGSRTTHQVISLKVTFVGATSVILDCVSMAASSESIWKLATNMTDIYFNSGNIGVGTSTPGSLLDIRGVAPKITLGDAAHLGANNSYSSFISGRDAANTEVWWVGEGSTAGKKVGLGSPRSDYDITLVTNNTERVIIDPAGRVGVGAGAPLFLLHANGDGVNKGIIGSSNSAAAAGNVVQMFADAPDVGVLNYGHTAGPGSGRLDLRVENSPRLTILNNGNIGIGTTAPTVNLDVNGALRAGSSASVSTCAGIGAANGEGSQRYNYGTHKMEYCNGASWVPLGTSGVNSIYTNNAGTVNYSANTIQVSGTTNGTPVHLFFSSNLQYDNNAGCTRFTIYRNAVAIKSWQIIGFPNHFTSVSNSYTDATPPNGAVTYQIGAQNFLCPIAGTGGVPQLSSLSLICLGCQ